MCVCVCELCTVGVGGLKQSSMYTCVCVLVYCCTCVHGCVRARACVCVRMSFTTSQTNVLCKNYGK